MNIKELQSFIDQSADKWTKNRFWTAWNMLSVIPVNLYNATGADNIYFDPQLNTVVVAETKYHFQRLFERTEIQIY